MSEKITGDHRERAAYVYVRQSTAYQVRHNQESQRRQYGLAERARQLGFRAVTVIDDDLGISGSGVRERPGFGRLLAAVCAGQVGAVLAIEASRLARNNCDWYHLLDLCALTKTLVVDHDGVYDPRLLNDRLLLGLKGTMSEFELGLLRQRSQEALAQMVRRGEVLSMVPVGYVRTEDNRCELTPDRQVQEALSGVFRKFRELGSARQVFLWYRQEQIPLPSVVPETKDHAVIWKQPIYHSIISLLKNPIYAGAFVHGRRQSRTTVVNGVARRTQGHVLPREQWPVVIQDHHPGYISWAEFERNQQLLESNYGMNGRMKAGAAKSGPALLAGLLRCARCGRKLHVGYSGCHGRVPRYFCRGGQLNHGTPWCISFGGLKPDQVVVTAVLEALQPLGVEAALQAWETASRGEDEKRRALRLAVEKAGYEAARAKRQFDAVEPENRLVAAELERRWNDALKKAAELEVRLAAEQMSHPAITSEERQRLLELGRDLEEAWWHPAASVQLKKRILRTVLEEVIVDLVGSPPEVQMRLHWVGGVHTLLRFPKNRTGYHRHATDREVVDVVRELAPVCADAALAAILNRMGYHTGTGKSWTASRVYSLRAQHELPAFSQDLRPTWVTMHEAAAELGIGRGVTRRLLKSGILPGRQVVPTAPWVIQRVHLALPEVRDAVQAALGGRRVPRTSPGQELLPFAART